MDKESMLQAAEDYWLEYSDVALSHIFGDANEYSWPWFWLILAESIWPFDPDEEVMIDFDNWLYNRES